MKMVHVCVSLCGADSGVNVDHGLEQQRTPLVQDRRTFLFLRQYPETIHRATTVEDGPIILIMFLQLSMISGCCEGIECTATVMSIQHNTTITDVIEGLFKFALRSYAL